ncbi:tRNA (N6-threonylcarbamoyladenosine(37)-N6)-methyltransferase TrmO [Syntrophomonas curvata]
MVNIDLSPVGYVLSPVEEPGDMPLGGRDAVIELMPEYAEALQGLEESSNIWILSWFHKAPRDVLKVKPGKVNPDLPEYGVFALRAYARPNPIGLSLVKLEGVDGNRVYVLGLDAVGGTPVLDIKPYFENDTIFSPLTPYVRGKSREMRRGMIRKHALVHHGEECPDMLIGVRMAAIAEDYFGQLNCSDLMVKVQGSPCLADTIQGISRARFANPPRFNYSNMSDRSETIWAKNGRVLTICLKDVFSREDINYLADEDLFYIF